MSENPIVFIDSGVGGLPYLKKTKEYLPDENFIYVADNQNFPYGEKNSKELTILITQLIESIVKKINPKLVVIACNTASVVTLSTLREKFGFPFVGVVPAIKPAGEYAVNGTIGLLATTKTVTDPYTDSLINQFASTSRVEKYAGINLVDFVESRFFNSTEQEKLEIVSQSSEHFNNLKIDALVLGCTHFVYLKEYFIQSISGNVDIIDSVEGVCQQILRIVEDNKNNRKKGNHSDSFLITGHRYDYSRYKKFSDEFNLNWSGQL